MRRRSGIAAVPKAGIREPPPAHGLAVGGITFLGLGVAFCYRKTRSGAAVATIKAVHSQLDTVLMRVVSHRKPLVCAGVPE